METAVKQDFKTIYLLRFYNQVQELVEKRKLLRVSQKEIARITEVSERKIQMFENYNCTDHYLLFCYQQILKL